MQAPGVKQVGKDPLPAIRKDVEEEGKERAGDAKARRDQNHGQVE